MSQKRKYDIGHGVVVSDDGRFISAAWKPSETSSTSVGIRRPPTLPADDQFSCRVSLDGQFYYVEDVAVMQGFWLSVMRYASQEQFEFMQERSNRIFGGGVKFKLPSIYYREKLDFCMFSVKERKDVEKRPKSDELVTDYLCIQQLIDQEDEKRFNEAIAFTGQTIETILKAIGPWVPIEEPAPARLFSVDAE